MAAAFAALNLDRSDALRPPKASALRPNSRTSSANGASIGHARAPQAAKWGNLMDERIEAFLKDVLALEGEISNLLREDARRQLVICEEQFRDAETNKRMKDRAGQACRTLWPHARSGGDPATKGNVGRRISEDSAQCHRLSGLVPIE